ncbi:MAG: pyridoxal phosphate-dependent class II aminotransferase [Eubacteriales bacterium]|nr:pyridoxal phosphate-dependent class II aminotransferase [Eubacteriales bacterium]
MKKDSHGGNIYKKAKELGIREEDILDFSANISPLGLPQEIREAMIQAVDGIINYPDPECMELREAIAACDHVEEEWIACGNGGADLLYRIAFGLKPKKVLLPVPAFVEYEEALTASGAEMVYVPMDETMLPGEEVIDQITEDIDLIVLCNPNNPTGLLVNRDFIIRVIEKAALVGAKLLLDECFLEICSREEAYTLKPYLGHYHNLMILKSFTKLYAIPGVRLGYLLSSNSDLIASVNHAGQAWSVSTMAQKAGVCALSLAEYKQAVIDKVAEELTFMKERMKALPIRLYDGQANYLFFRAPGCTDLDRRLEKKGIMIRNCSNYVNLTNDYWRVAVKDRASNERLIAALKEVF